VEKKKGQEAGEEGLKPPLTGHHTPFYDLEKYINQDSCLEKPTIVHEDETWITKEAIMDGDLVRWKEAKKDV
jgi:hypothetical protein